VALDRVPPGRAGLLWLRHRLTVARRGLDLLRRKQMVLAKELERLREEVVSTGEAWRLADAHGRLWLVRGAAVGGTDAVRAALPATPAVVTPHRTTVVGVSCPTEPDVQLPAPDRDAAPASPAIEAATAAYRRALPAAARHAAAVAAVGAVEAEMVTTRQRVHALERRWIPRLETATARLRLQMAELEDADAVRRRRAGGVTR
jgi:V/A-type H+-transporting ATPase subunit D